MNIYTSPIKLSANILSFEHIDLDDFEEKFKPFLEQNPQLLKIPLYFNCTETLKLTLPELSILIDSLKDMKVYIAGLVCKEKSVRKFSEYLGIPSFSTVDSIGFEITRTHQLTNQTPAPTAQVKTSQEPFINQEKTPQDSNYLNFGSASVSEQQNSDDHLNLSIPKTPIINEHIALSSEDQKALINSNPAAEKKYQKQGKTIYQPVNDFQSTVDVSLRKEDNVANDVQSNQSSSLAVPKMPKESLSNRHQANAIQNNSQEKVGNQSTQVNLNGGDNHSLTEPEKSPLLINQPISTGKTVRHNGDVILLNTLAKGSVISATGSVHCYDKVLGTILAGSSGNVNARIYATNLNCEAIAIAGFYAKYHQYSKVLNGNYSLMVALKNGNLNFSAVQKMPTVNNFIKDIKKENQPLSINLKEYKEEDILSQSLPKVSNDLNRDNLVNLTNGSSSNNLQNTDTSNISLTDQTADNVKKLKSLKDYLPLSKYSNNDSHKNQGTIKVEDYKTKPNSEGIIPPLVHFIK